MRAAKVTGYQLYVETFESGRMYSPAGKYAPEEMLAFDDRINGIGMRSQESYGQKVLGVVLGGVDAPAPAAIEPETTNATMTPAAATAAVALALASDDEEPAPAPAVPKTQFELDVDMIAGFRTQLRNFCPHDADTAMSMALAVKTVADAGLVMMQRRKLGE